MTEEPRTQDTDIPTGERRDWPPFTERHQAIIHYTIYLPDQTTISSYETGSAYRLRMNDEQVIPGIVRVVENMSVGETRRIRLTPEQAFGSHRDDRVLEASHEHVRSPVELQEGMPVRLRLPDREELAQAYVRETRDGSVLFDLNHPLAGQELTIDVTLVSFE